MTADRSASLVPATARAREPGPLGLSWTARVEPACSGAENMARDHALALELPAGGAALRLYRWNVPTLSLGRNEPAFGRYDPDLLRRLGVAVVRRPSGGRAVLHWRELTYAVALPASTLGPRAAYRWINELLAGALASLGVPAEIAPRAGRAQPPDAGPCFRGSAPGEVVVQGRKLVGSAQVRIRRALLQHGSILLEDDQGQLQSLGAPADGVAPATLSDLLDRPLARDELEVALLKAFEVAAEEGPPSQAIERELELRYRSDAWTWRC